MNTWFKQFIARPWASIIALKYHTLFGKPYFKMIIFRIRRGDCAIDAHFNIHFKHNYNYVTRATM